MKKKILRRIGPNLRQVGLLLVLSCLLVSSQGIKAQSFSLDTDSIGSGSKVLIIPFQPVRYYFSDCDKQLSTFGKTDIRDVRSTFRAGMNVATAGILSTRHDVVDMYNSEDSLAMAELNDFYDQVTYRMQESAVEQVEVEGDSKPLFSKMKSVFKGTKEDKIHKNMNEMEAYSEVKSGGEAYMGLEFTSAEVLSALSEKYAPEYIVTINQFEISTDLEKCIDRELGKFGRKIKVHYNVFNSDGRKIKGDVITARYNSNTPDIAKIMEDNFGFLANYISRQVP